MLIQQSLSHDWMPRCTLVIPPGPCTVLLDFQMLYAFDVFWKVSYLEKLVQFRAGSDGRLFVWGALEMFYVEKWGVWHLD